MPTLNTLDLEKVISGVSIIHSMADIVLSVIKILLWSLAGIAALAALLLTVPVFYKARMDIYGDIKASSLELSVGILGFVLTAVMKRSADDTELYIRIFGIKIILKNRSTGDERELPEQASGLTADAYDGDTEKDGLKQELPATSYTHTGGRIGSKRHLTDAEDEDGFLYGCIKRKIDSIYGRLRKLYELIISLNSKKDSLMRLYETSACQSSIELLKNKLPRLIRHILPGRIEGRVHFGFEECDRTGMALAYYSIINSFLDYNIYIEPDFEKKCIDGTLTAKGRIVLVYVIAVAARVWLDKNFRLTLSRLKKIIRRR